MVLDPSLRNSVEADGGLSDFPQKASQPTGRDIRGLPVVVKALPQTATMIAIDESGK
jgi:hypothetical protein